MCWEKAFSLHRLPLHLCHLAKMASTNNAVVTSVTVWFLLCSKFYWETNMYLKQIWSNSSEKFGWTLVYIYILSLRISGIILTFKNDILFFKLAVDIVKLVVSQFFYPFFLTTSESCLSVRFRGWSFQSLSDVSVPPGVWEVWGNAWGTLKRDIIPVRA